MSGTKHLEKAKQNEYKITYWFFRKLIENKPRINPKSLREIARENIKLDDEQLIDKIAKKTINLYCFTDWALQSR